MEFAESQAPTSRWIRHCRHDDHGIHIHWGRVRSIADMKESGGIFKEDVSQRIVQIGLLVALLVMPFQQTVNLPIVGPKIALVEIVLLIPILVWTLSKIRTRRLPSTALNLPLACFLAVGLLSGITILRESLGSDHIAVFAFEFVNFVYLAVLFLVVTETLADRKLFDIALVVLALSTSLVILFGVLGSVQMLQCPEDVLSSPLVYYSIRLTSIFRNPNQLAAYLVAMIPLFATLWVSSDSFPWKRGSVYVGILLAVIGFFFAASIGGWLGLGAGLLFLCVIMARSRRTWAIGAGVIVVSVVLSGVVRYMDADASRQPCLQYLTNITYVPQNTVGSLLGIKSYELPLIPIRTAEGGFILQRGSDPASEGMSRLVLARFAFELVAQHPVTGVGLGTMYLWTYEEIGRENPSSNLSAHNTFLTLWAETGTLGLACFVWILVTTFLQVRRNYLNAASSYDQAVSAGLAVALLSLLVMGLTFDAERQRHLWLIIALIFAQGRLLDRISPPVQIAAGE